MLFLDMRRRYSITLAALVGIIMTQHAQAEHFMDQWPQCPPMRTHPSKLCPPDETLIWTECPKYWPGDKTIEIGPSSLASGHWKIPSTIDYERNDLNEDSPQIRIDCIYGGLDKKFKSKLHITLEPPHPVVQCGEHETPDGLLFGCSSQKTESSLMKERYFISEIISIQTKLKGVGLGWTKEQVKKFANDQGYTIKWAEGHSPTGNFISQEEGLYGQGLALSVVYDESTTRLTKEVIVSAGWQDHDSEEIFNIAVRKFGFGFRTDSFRNDGLIRFIWTSPDNQVAVEFWPDNRPKAPASLHLIDKRKLTPSDHSR